MAMELQDFEPAQFSSCGMDAKAVQAVQTLKYLGNFTSNTSKMFLEDIASCSNPSEPMPEEGLSSDEVVETTKKGVLVTGFLLGFQVLEPEAVDLLAERTINHLDKMCRQLSVLADRRRRGRPCAFINPMHQVLDMNNLSIPILHSFYCTRYLNLCNNPLKRLRKLEANQERSGDSSTSKLISRKRKASNISAEKDKVKTAKVMTECVRILGYIRTRETGRETKQRQRPRLNQSRKLQEQPNAHTPM